MSNTANSSLAKVQKAEKDAAEMITQAQKVRDEKVTKKQADLQKKYIEAEDSAKEKANTDISRYKDEVSDTGKQMLHDAKRESEQLKTTLDSKIDSAANQGVNILKTTLGL